MSSELDCLKIREYLKANQGVLNIVWQNPRMKASDLTKFAKDHGISVFRNDPESFHAKGWLMADDANSSGEPLYHPFRIYPLHRILEMCSLNITASSTLHREGFLDLVQEVHARVPDDARIGELAAGWNHIIDLAVVLEPLWWPDLTSRQIWNGFYPEEVFRDSLQKYSSRTDDLVKSLDPEKWKKLHDQLKWSAHCLDSNDELYLLLRVSKWNKRMRLVGKVAGSLWLRHIAEVIRLAFQQSHNVDWHEEDYATGQWATGSRTIWYGLEKPLDDIHISRPYIASGFGLYTGTAVRWYVEGKTEQYAVTEILEEPAKYGIELIDLKGKIGGKKGNYATRLQDELDNDRKCKRFSIVSIDTDVSPNVKAVRVQVERDNIVGYIAAHTPDFELANFTPEELASLAAEYDEGEGFSGESLRSSDLSTIKSMSDFSLFYKQHSERSPRPLEKGEEWGRLLGKRGWIYPVHPSTNQKRPFVEALLVALRARTANYDTHHRKLRIDSDSFKQVERNIPIGLR